MELKRDPNGTPDPGSLPERFLRGQGATRVTRGPRRLRRARLRKLAALALAASALSAAIWLGLAASSAPSLFISRVWVEGNERLSDGEILELLDLDTGTNILTADLLVLREKLLRSAWVRDVELSRVFPATLTLRIVERTPVTVAVLDELYLLAADGTILDQLSPRYDVASLVLARGVAGPEGLVPERAELAGRVAARLAADERLALEVSEVDVSEGEDSVRLHLRTFPVTVLGSEDTLVERLSEILPFLGGVLSSYPDLDVVDLRFDGRVFLRSRQPGPEGLYTSTAFGSGGATF